MKKIEIDRILPGEVSTMTKPVDIRGSVWVEIVLMLHPVNGISGRRFIRDDIVETWNS